MAATVTKLPVIGKRTTNRIKKAWDKLESRGNHLDFDRAKLLHEVWTRYQRNDKNLATFTVKVLGEYGGKRTLAFIRLVHAYDEIQDIETWTKLGGKGVVMLSRVRHKTKRKKLLREVDKSMERTGRTTTTIGTFRNIAQSVLGEDAYRSTLSEPHGRSNLSVELALLKGFLIELIGKNPDLSKGMPRKVKKALGLDLVQRRSG